MTLKELYEEDRKGETIRDIVSRYLLKPTQYRAKYTFEDYLEELEKCPKCGEINERIDMDYHKWDIGGNEELICESCRNDEDI